MGIGELLGRYYRDFFNEIFRAKMMSNNLTKNVLVLKSKNITDVQNCDYYRRTKPNK